MGLRRIFELSFVVYFVINLITAYIINFEQFTIRDPSKFKFIEQGSKTVRDPDNPYPIWPPKVIVGMLNIYYLLI